MQQGCNTISDTVECFDDWSPVDKPTAASSNNFSCRSAYEEDPGSHSGVWYVNSSRIKSRSVASDFVGSRTSTKLVVPRRDNGMRYGITSSCGTNNA
jgi:hypothetical protein